jgi:RNA polymerase sigma factor for flagellar operon FliA
VDVDAARRRKLVDENLDLVHRIASRIHEHVRSYVELNELVSMGTTGLIEAAGRYDAAHQASFRTYAYYRIRGAIYDGLRKMSHLPRRAHRLLVAARQADAYLEDLHQRPDPDAAGTGAAAGGTPRAHTANNLRRLYQAMCGVATVLAVSPDAPLEAGSRIPCPSDAPDTMLARARLWRQVSEAVQALPARERHFIVKCYFEGKTLVEAGAELGLSRSWSSRLHARAVDKLRQRLMEQGAEPPDD